MALENFVGTITQVPSEYGIPVPTGIKKFLESVINLPKPASSGNYGYYTKFKVISNMYYVTALSEFNNHDDTVTNAGVATYFRFIDPNSVFILPNLRQNIFPYNYKMQATNGYPPIIESEVGQNDNKNPFIYAFPADSGGYRGGAISVNTDDESNSVSLLSDGIDVICKISFTYHDDDKNRDYSGTDTISIISSLGMYKGFSTIYSDYSSHVSNLGRSVKLGYNVFRQDTIFADNLTTYYLGSKGFSAYLNDILLANSSFDNARRWNNSNNISSDLFYLLFPKVVFADTASRIDTLLNMTAEDFKKEIKYDIGKDPYSPVNPSAPSGGNGGYGSGEGNTPTFQDIPDGTSEVNDSANSMYTRYLISIPELSGIGSWFWTDDLGLAIAKSIISAFYGNPVDTVISCVSYPFDVGSLASNSGGTMYWGGDNSNRPAQILNTNAIQINWGTISLTEYFGSFLDYAPYTKMQLFLPWGTGFIDIDPADIFQVRKNTSFPQLIPDGAGTGILSIMTNIDLSKGLCVHNVIANGAVIGAYSGSCGRQIPITGSDYASKQVALVGAAIGAISAATIGAASALDDIIGGATIEHMYTSSGDMFKGAHKLQPLDIAEIDSTKTRYVGSRTHAGKISDDTKQLVANASKPAIASAAAIGFGQPHVSRSGSFQEGTGGMTIQYPYLMISRPIMSKPNSYGYYYGYPSNIYESLGSLSGYTEVASIHLDGFPATVGEIMEIDSLLKGGVIL